MRRREDRLAWSERTITCAMRPFQSSLTKPRCQRLFRQLTGWLCASTPRRSGKAAPGDRRQATIEFMTLMMDSLDFAQVNGLNTMPPSPSKGQTPPKRGGNPSWIAVQIGDVVNANIEMMPDGVRVTSDSDDPQLMLEPTGLNSMATHAMTIDFVNFGPPLIEPKIYVDQGGGFDEA